MAHPPDQGPESEESRRVDRRGFLRSGLAGALGAVLLSRRASEAEAAPDGYRVTGWSGDSYKHPHRFRDGFAPKPSGRPERHEVVVVGGGLAGLTAAFRTRHTDLLVLERADEFGGNAKARRFNGLDYNIGSAYLTGIEGEHGKLYGELGLEMTALKEPVDRWYRGGRWFDGMWHDEAIRRQPPALQKAMAGLKRALKQLVESKDFPQSPYQLSTAAALKLDRIPFAAWLKPYAHPELMTLINAYCYSAMGASAKVVSAYGGINFYSEILGKAYSFPAGNAEVARALARGVDAAGKRRIRTGCYVYRVIPRGDDRAEVHYHWQGEARIAEAKRVILSVPYFIASRLIEDLSPGQRYALGCQRYASYIVANLCFDRVVAAAGYDNWSPSRAGFQDYVPADWSARATGDRDPTGGQVVALFAPCKHPVLGRFKMMTGSPAQLARPLVDRFFRLHPEAKAHLREVHMTRWGHAFLINRTGVYTQWLPRIRKQVGPIHLAHSDGQGVPAVESSVHEAITAARRILKTWNRRG